MAAKQPKVIVQVDNHFSEWGRNVERGIFEGLMELEPVLVAEARRRETAYRGGALRDGVDGTGVARTERGFTAGIGDSDFKAVWFEKGTAAHSTQAGARGAHSLTKTGRKRRKAAGLTSGVRGLHYLRDTVYAMRPVIMRRLGEKISRAKTGLL